MIPVELEAFDELVVAGLEVEDDASVFEDPDARPGGNVDANGDREVCLASSSSPLPVAASDLVVLSSLFERSALDSCAMLPSCATSSLFITTLTSTVRLVDDPIFFSDLCAVPRP